MRCSVRGGSKVAKGTRRRRRRRAEHETPPPSGDGEAPGFPFGRSPSPPGPVRMVTLPGPGLNGKGALPLVYVRCCWPSYCSAVGSGIKALRGRLRRGSFRAPGALAWIRPLRPRKRGASRP